MEGAQSIELSTDFEEILDITLMDHGLMSVHSFIQRRSLFKKTRLSEQPSYKLN